MTFDQLKTFYVVASAGSFTNAAAELNMDQSNVSRKIITMETRLRVKLFTRRSRGLVLTPEGQALLEETREVLNRIEGMKNIVKNIHKEAKGLLKVNVQDSFYDHFILSHFYAFLHQYPDIQVTLSKEDIDVSVLESSDMMVGVGPYVKNGQNVIQEFLMRLHIKLYASSLYLEKFGVPTRVEDLSQHRLLAYGPKNDLFSVINWHLFTGLSFGEHRDPYLQTGCFKTRLNLVENGLGIGTFAAEMVVGNKKLVPLLVDQEGGIIDFFYSYPAIHKNAIPVRRFGEFVHGIFKRVRE